MIRLERRNDADAGHADVGVGVYKKLLLGKSVTVMHYISRLSNRVTPCVTHMF